MIASRLLIYFMHLSLCFMKFSVFLFCFGNYDVSHLRNGNILISGRMHIIRGFRCSAGEPQDTCLDGF